VVVEEDSVISLEIVHVNNGRGLLKDAGRIAKRPMHSFGHVVAKEVQPHYDEMIDLVLDSSNFVSKGVSQLLQDPTKARTKKEQLKLLCDELLEGLQRKKEGDVVMKEVGDTEQYADLVSAVHMAVIIARQAPATGWQAEGVSAALRWM